MPNKTDKTPREIAINTHNARGFTGANYAGLSKPRNSGIAKPANTGTSKATPRTIAQLTERMRATLTQLGTAYGNGSFPLCGIDRGQLAIFINSGFVVATGDNGKLAGDAAKQFIKPATATAKPATAKPAKPATAKPASEPAKPA